MKTRRRKLVSQLLVSVALLILAGQMTTSKAQFAPNPIWENVSFGGQPSTHGLGCDPDYPGGGFCVVASGPYVTAFWSEDYCHVRIDNGLRYCHKAGDQIGSPWKAPALLQISPPVPIRERGDEQPHDEAIFASGSDGFLYELFTYDNERGYGLYPGPGMQVTKCPNLQVGKLSAPVAQQWALSNPDFQKRFATSIAYVITDQNCLGNAQQVYAFNDTLGVEWTFDADDSYQVSAGHSPCTVDYTRNLLYCATVKSQGWPTLWAIDTLGKVAAQPAWSAYVGDVETSPKIGYGGKRLYVANEFDRIIYSINIDRPGNATNCEGKNVGEVCWSMSLPFLNLLTDISVGFRPGGKNWIFIAGPQGPASATVAGVTDEGEVGIKPIQTINWTASWGSQGSPEYIWAAPLFLPSEGLIYVATSLGIVREVTSDDGTETAYHTAYGKVVGSLDVILDRSPAAQPNSSDRLMATSPKNVDRFGIPWRGFVGTSTSPQTSSGTTVTSTMTDPTTTIMLTTNAVQATVVTQQNATSFTTTQAHTGYSTSLGTVNGASTSITTLTTTIPVPVTLTTTTMGESTYVTCILSSGCYTLTSTGNQTLTLTTAGSSTVSFTQTTVMSSTGNYSVVVQTTGNSTLTITNQTGVVYTSTFTGPYTLTVESASTTTWTSTFGTLQASESSTSSTTAPSTVVQPPQCVIATAAYGSELAAPVQFLRNFRDRQVQRTYLGSRFLSAFNAWYYSWAPSIARQEAKNDFLRGAVRVVILPLLGALFTTQQVFAGLSSVSPDFAIVVSGMIASSLIGAVYLTPFAYLGQRLLRRRVTRRTFLFALIAGLLLALWSTLGYGSTEPIQILDAALVIVTILTAPLIVTWKLAPSKL